MNPTIAAIAEAARRVCPTYGLDPQACVAAAVAISRDGLAAVRWNCWGLSGCGDGPDLLLTTAHKLDRPPYLRLVDQPVSVFTSPESAVQAWCETQRRDSRRG